MQITRSDFYLVEQYRVTQNILVETAPTGASANELPTYGVISISVLRECFEYKQGYKTR